MLKRSVYDVQRRWIEKGPSDRQLLAMIMDPRTAQGMQHVDSDSGVDVCGLNAEQRARAVELFKQRVAEMQDAKATVELKMAQAQAESADNAPVEPTEGPAAELGANEPLHSPSDSSGRPMPTAPQGTSDFFESGMGDMLVGAGTLASCGMSLDLGAEAAAAEAEQSEADQYLKLVRSVPLVKLLKQDVSATNLSKAPLPDIFDITEVEPVGRGFPDPCLCALPSVL